MTLAQTEIVQDAQVFPLASADGSFRRRLRRYRLGLSLVICAIVMLFASFFSAYVVRKGVANYDYAARGYSAEWQPFKLPAGMLGVATGLLLLTGVSIELARRKTFDSATGITSGSAAHGIWIWLSNISIAAFLLTLVATWNGLGNSGHSAALGSKAAFFYLLTGVHAIHVGLALLILGYFTFRPGGRKEDRAIALDLGAWYCYAMIALWFCIMLLLI